MSELAVSFLAACLIALILGFIIGVVTLAAHFFGEVGAICAGGFIFVWFMMYLDISLT